MHTTRQVAEFRRAEEKSRWVPTQLDNPRAIARGHWVGSEVPEDLVRREQLGGLALAVCTVYIVAAYAF